ASTTKIMSLYLIFEAMEKGRMNLDTPITISQEMYRHSINPDWSNVPLMADQQYTVRQLIEATCVPSGCASIMVLGEYLDGTIDAFVAHMNQKAKEMGLNASFADATGVSGSSKISARSLAELSRIFIEDYPEFLNFTSLTSTTIDGKTYYATNQLLPGKNYDYLGADGIKTGSTTPAGKCMVGTAQRNGTRIITVVLAAASIDRRYIDTVALLDYGFEQAPNYPLIFKDVARNSWYYPYVETAYNRGLVNGTATYTFSPEEKIDRAMFVTVMGRLWEQETGNSVQSNVTFPDVEAGQWYQKYVDWAASNDIVIGYEDGYFRPYNTITREEMMEILYNYNTFLNGEESLTEADVLSAFADADTISAWAVNSASWCVDNGIINGIDATHIDAGGNAIRSQMVKVFVEYSD
ncbi:MAG: S-layer homology domain-containing protein, partial [Bacillota bacterium]|nr:S-layer homology domain-containing protein [Bacillota bacterium]